MFQGSNHNGSAQFNQYNDIYRRSENQATIIPSPMTPKVSIEPNPTLDELSIMLGCQDSGAQGDCSSGYFSEEDIHLLSPQEHPKYSVAEYKSKSELKTIGSGFLQGKFSSKYSWEIYLIAIQKEMAHHPRNYISDQLFMDCEMRSTLLRWLYTLSRTCNYSIETFCLMTNVIDRFLSTTNVARECLQLVGATAFLIAAKMLESTSPPINEMARLCNHIYTSKQLICMELVILQRLNFNLHVSTPGFFLDIYSSWIHDLIRDDPSLSTQARLYHTISCSILGESIQDYYLSQYPPPVLAMASILMTCLGHRQDCCLKPNYAMLNVFKQVLCVAKIPSRTLSASEVGHACYAMHHLMGRTLKVELRKELHCFFADV